MKRTPTRIGIRVILLQFLLFAIIYNGQASHPGKTVLRMLNTLSFPESSISNINTIYIPFTLVGRLMIVQAKADGISGNFIVDTGSERLLINKDYVPELIPGRQITSIGNTGYLNVTEHQVDSLRLDQLTIPNLMAHIVDLNHIEIKKNTTIRGILGYNVFKEFELFIDFPNGRIVLSRVDKIGLRLDRTIPWELPYDSLSFELKKHFIVIRAAVNNVNLNMILDSGAELNLLDRKVNKKAIEKFSIIKRVNLIGIGKKQVEVLAGVLSEVRCGNQKSDGMNTLLTSLDEINTSFGISVQGVLGYEFLNTRRTMINYKKRKLYFFGPLRS